MPKKFKSKAFETIHSAVAGMAKSGTIDKATMREFDDLCLVEPKALKPNEIKKLRESQQVSQPIFAHYLNTSESTIKKWETGEKQPSGMGLRLLNVIQKHGLKVLT